MILFKHPHSGIIDLERNWQRVECAFGSGIDLYQRMSDLIPNFTSIFPEEISIQEFHPNMSSKHEVFISTAIYAVHI